MKECPDCHRCFPDHVNHCPSDGDLLKFTLPGDTVLDERYQLEKRLGQGGMGIVFKARHGRGWVMVVDGAESEVYEADGKEPGDLDWGGERFLREGAAMPADAAATVTTYDAVLFGAVGTGVGLADDLSRGVVDRLRALPIARAAILGGRAVARSSERFGVRTLDKVAFGWNS